MKRLFLMALAWSLVMAGCTLAPKYEPPDTPVPGTWPQGEAYGDSARSKEVPLPQNLAWREFFTDERLRQVIDLALANNRDLRLAALNVEMSRATYGIQRASLYPALSVSGSGSKSRIPGDLSTTGKRRTSTEYSVDLGILSWEIDFFGRIRSLKDQALEEYLASEEGRRGTQLLLISEVANAYLSLGADRENLALTRSTLDTQQASYDMIRRRYETGLASELELRQAQTQVDVARRNAATYTRMTAQDQNALTLLVGAPLPKELLPESLQGVSAPREVSAGLASEVLLKRPDILQAEHLLKASNANIGAARAAFFPSISLTAAIGTASADLSGLFEPGSGTWKYAPQVALPIFDPRLLPALRASKVDREILIAQYEQAIQKAFREVADVLATQGTVDQELEAQQSLVDATAVTYRLSDARYRMGVDSYLDVLDAQRSLYAAQQELISVQLSKMVSQIQLYAALGGGGDLETPENPKN
jgi:multidrug efflux system outer membrane protein